MIRLRQTYERLLDSATLLSQASALISIGSGLIVLPLMVIRLEQADIALWLYYSLFISLGMMSDLGFGQALLRASSYFRNGVQDLPMEGEIQPASGRIVPNLGGLADLLATFRHCYFYILGGAMLIAGGFGSVLSYPLLTRGASISAGALAGAAIWIGLGFSLASAVWSNYLQGLGFVAESKRVDVLIGLFRIAGYSLLLLLGGGILGMALVSLTASLLQWRLLRKRAIAAFVGLGGAWPLQGRWNREIFRRLWPSTWRQGVIGVGGYLINQSGGLVASRISDTGLLATYLLTLRLLGVIRSVALAPVQVAVPRFVAFRATGDREGLWNELVKRIALCLLLAVGGSLALWLAAISYSTLFVRPMPILPAGMYAFAVITAVLEVHHCAHSIIYITKNKVPFLWGSVISGGAIIVLSVLVVGVWGVWGLLFVQFGIQLCFNNWYPVYLVLKDCRGLRLDLKSRFQKGITAGSNISA